MSAPLDPIEASGPDKYDLTLDRIEAEERASLERLMHQVDPYKPEHAAEVQRLAKEINVPAYAAPDDVPSLRVQARQKLVRQLDLHRNAPALARKLREEFEFAKIAQDQIPQLSAVEKAVQQVSDFGTAFRGGFSEFSSTGRGDLMMKIRGGSATPEEVAESARLRAENAELLRGRSFGASAGQIAGQMTANLVDAVQDAVVVTLPVAATGLVFPPALAAAPNVFAGTVQASFALRAVGQAAALSKERMLDEGIDPDEAHRLSFEVGLAVGALEIVGLKAFGKALGPTVTSALTRRVTEKVAEPATRSALVEFGKRYGTAVATETSTEVLQQIVEIAGSEAGRRYSNLPLLTETAEGRDRIVEELADVAVMTLKGMAVLGGLGAGVGVTVDRMAARRAERTAKFSDDVAAAVEASEVLQRNPDAMADLVTAAATANNAPDAFIRGDALAQVLEENSVPVEDLEAKMPGLKAKLEQALRTDSDVRVAAGDYFAHLTSDPRLKSVLSQHVRFAEDQVSLFDAQRQEELAEAYSKGTEAKNAEQAAAAKVAAQEDAAARKLVRDLVARDRRLTKTQREAISGVVSSAVINTARRIGLTPQELLESYPLQAQIQASPPANTLAMLTQEDPVLRDEAGAPVQLFETEGQRTLTTVAPAEGARAVVARVQRPYFATEADLALAETLGPDVVPAFEAGLREQGYDAVVYRPAEGPMQVVPFDQAAVVEAPSPEAATPEGAVAQQQDSVLRGMFDIPNWMITLFKDSNPTTFLHEFSHWMLEVHGQLALRVQPELQTLQTRIGDLEAFILDARAKAEATAAGVTTQKTDEIAALLAADPEADVTALQNEIKAAGKVAEEAAADERNQREALIDRQRTLQLVASDFQVFLDESGVASPEAWAQMTVEEKRPHHERIASQWEQYLADGKAPSAKLEQYFRRLARIFIDIYRDVRAALASRFQQQFGEDLPDVSPEARAVFDRWLAADEVVRNYEARRGLVALYEDQADSGLSLEQWEAYRALFEADRFEAVERLVRGSRRTMSWLRTAQKIVGRPIREAAEARVEALRPSVEAQVRDLPLYQAIDVLRNGPVDQRQARADAKVVRKEAKEAFKAQHAAARQIVEDAKAVRKQARVDARSAKAALVATQKAAAKVRAEVGTLRDKSSAAPDRKTQRAAAKALRAGRTKLAEARGKVKAAQAKYATAVEARRAADAQLVQARKDARNVLIAATQQDFELGEARRAVIAARGEEAGARREAKAGAARLKSAKARVKAATETAKVKQAAFEAVPEDRASRKKSAKHAAEQAALRQTKAEERLATREAELGPLRTALEEASAKTEAARAELEAKVAAATSPQHKLSAEAVEQLVEAYAKRTVAKQNDATRQRVERAALKGRKIKGTIRDAEGLAQQAEKLKKRLVAKLGPMTHAAGMQPDEVAGLFGYDSGQAFVEALLEAPSFDQAVDQRIATALMQAYGEEMKNGVQAAVHNDARSRFAALEAALLQKTESARNVREAAKMAAERRLSRMTLDEVRKNRFRLEEARASRSAVYALKARPKKPKQADTIDGALQASNSDFIAPGVASPEFRAQQVEQAIRFKQEQVLKSAMAAQAVEINEDVEKFRALAKKFFASDEKLGKRKDVNYIDLGRGLLATHGLGRDEKTFGDYVEKLKQFDPEAYNDIEQLLTQAAPAANIPFKSLTVDQFQTLEHTITALWEMAGKERQIELAGQVEQLADVRAKGLESIAAVAGKKGILKADSVFRKVRNVTVGMQRMLPWAKEWDAVAGTDFMSKYVWRPVERAFERYVEHRQAQIRKLNDLVKQLGLRPGKIDLGRFFSDLAPHQDRVTVLGERDGQGLAELLGALMHYGNRQNWERVTLGAGWAERLDDGTVDTSRADAMVQALADEGTLTAKHFEVLQQIGDSMEELLPLQQKAHRYIYGYFFDTVKIQPITTPFGVTRGWYAPLALDTERSLDSAHKQKLDNRDESGNRMWPSAPTGQTETRVERYDEPVRMDIRLAAKSYDDALRLAYMGPVVRDVMRVVNHHDFRDAIRQVDKEAVDNLLVPWLTDVARNKTNQPSNAPVMDAILRRIRATVAIARMMGNATNAALQSTGLGVAAVLVRPRFIRSAFIDVLRRPRESYAFAMDNSKFIKQRIDGEMSRVAFELENALGPDNLINLAGTGRYQRWVSLHSQLLQSWTQGHVDVMTWNAAYQQAASSPELAGLADAERHERAAVEADEVVMRTQGGSRSIDRSRLERGNSFTQLFTQFLSYGMTKYQFLRGEVQAARFSDMSRKQKLARISMVVLMGHVAMALLNEMVLALSRGQAPWDDDEGDGLDADELMAWFLRAQAKEAAPYLGPGAAVANLGLAMTTEQRWDDQLSLGPAFGTGGQALLGTYNLLDATFDDSKDVSGKNLRDALTLLDLVLGLGVSGTVGRPLSYGYDVARGAVRPSSTPDLVRGLVTGTAAKDTKVSR